MDERTDKETFVIVESLLQLKTAMNSDLGSVYFYMDKSWFQTLTGFYF